MNELNYLRVVAVLPAVLFWLGTGYATGAGCYAVNMNCFSVVVPTTSPTELLFAAARILPFAAPAGLLLASTGLYVLHRAGARGFERWLLVTPVLRVVLIHAACILFAGWVMPERRVTPTLAFDLALLAAGCAWVALATAAKSPVLRLLSGKPNRWARPA